MEDDSRLRKRQNVNIRMYGSTSCDLISLDLSFFIYTMGINIEAKINQYKALRSVLIIILAHTVPPLWQEIGQCLRYLLALHVVDPDFTSCRAYDPLSFVRIYPREQSQE